MRREFAKIVANDKIGEDVFLMCIHSPGIAGNWIPGQFLHILPLPKADTVPMLRRPISILSSKGSEVEIVYRVIGSGTMLISKMQAGEEIDIIGPLGNGFMNIPDDPGKHILVGGGVGIPPMIALARTLKTKGFDVALYQGARNHADLIFHEEIENERFSYYVTTEDGSFGTAGLITDILPESSNEIACVYACGPVGMIKAVLKWRREMRFPFYVSMETKFACGVGVCLGCSIPTIEGDMIRVCRNGPVFNADLIDWDRL